MFWTCKRKYDKHKIFILSIYAKNDTTKDKKVKISNSERIDLLVKTIKEELKDYDKFIVKTIQICYDDNYEKYQNVKEEDITKIVCI